MKSIILFFLSLLFFQIAFGQNYYVLKVEGQVSYDDKILKKGDQIPQESQIQFSKISDKLFLMSPKKGYKILSPETQERSGKNELLVAIQEAVLPKNKSYMTASRGSTELALAPFEDIYDMMAFFKDEVVMLEKNLFPLDANYFNFKNGEYFEASTSKCDQRTFKLSIHDDNLIINSKNLDPGCERISLHLIKADSKIFIGEFTPINMTSETLMSEISTFMDHANSPDDYAYEQAIAYISDHYGKIHKSSILK